MSDFGLKSTTQVQGPGYTLSNEKKIITYITKNNGRSFGLDVEGLLNIHDGEIDQFIRYMMISGYPLSKFRLFRAISANLSSDWVEIWEEPKGSDMSGKDIPDDIIKLSKSIMGEYFIGSIELTFKWV